MASKLMIVDYEMGNLNSVKRKLARLKVDALISSKPEEVQLAKKLILPGVGHFKKAMDNLKRLDLLEVLEDRVMGHGVPILGICLGMQLMAQSSEEGGAQGLGWFEAEVVKFRVEDKLTHKVPHMGWNQVHQAKPSRLLEEIPDLSEFYFVHSYHFEAKNQSDVLNETIYESRFVSAVERDNLFGVQYHPEKSHDIGERLLQNFVLL